MAILTSGAGSLKLSVPQGASLVIRNLSGVETVIGSGSSREDASSFLGADSYVYGPQSADVVVTISTTGTLDYSVVVGDPTPSISTPTTGSGSVAVQALSADRALASGDLAANLVLTANRAVTLASGLGAGFNTQFSNGGSSSVTITVTPGAGVTLNGASSAVTRTLAAGGTTALIPVGTNAYILPGV